MSDYYSSQVAPTYSGIWKLIDDGSFDALRGRDDLLYLINDKQKGVTPLWLATKLKRYEFILLLLANGADPNVVCRDATPLWLACFHGVPEIVAALLDSGADRNVVCSGSSPLHVATARGLVEVCEILCARGADVNVNSPKLGTALHVAVQRQHKFVLDILLQYKPDLSLTNRHGETIVHLAAASHDDSMIRLLLKSNLYINPLWRDQTFGSTIAHITTDPKIYKLLVTRWPELITETDHSGRTSAFFMPGSRPPFFMSMSAKLQETAAQHLYKMSQTGQYTDLIIICPQTFLKIKPTATITTENSSDENSDSTADSAIEVVQTQPETVQIKCHKALLWTRSKKFREIHPDTGFQAINLNDSPVHQILEVPEFSSNSMHAVIYYVYTDLLKCPGPQLDELIIAATHFGLDRLATMARAKLGSKADVPPPTYEADLKRLLVTPAFADVKLLIDHSQFLRHRFLLAAHSQFFATLFQAPMIESRTGIIQLDTFKSEDISAYLHWMYTFSLPPTINTPQKALHLYEIATVYLSPSMAVPIQSKVIEMMNTFDLKNFLLIASESYRLGAQILVEECALYFSCKTLFHDRIRSGLPARVCNHLESLVQPRDEASGPIRRTVMAPTSASIQLRSL